MNTGEKIIITIIRIHAHSKQKPAGQTYLFEDWSEEKNFKKASEFMLEKDATDFVVIKDGCEVDLRGIYEVEDIYQVLKDFKSFL